MRVWIISGKRLLMGISLFTAITVFAVGSAVFIKDSAPTAGQPKKLPIYSVETDEKKIGITFDAAWGNSDTDQLIQVLKKHNAKATFFATGEWVDRYPEDVKKLYSLGHDIQNHSNQHPHVAEIDAKQLTTDTDACDDKIEKLIGKRPTLYRAPYGEYDNEMLDTIEKTHQVIQWNVDSRDWKRPTVEKMVESVTKHTCPGSILLFHNDIPSTPIALDAILTMLDKEGYRYVLVSELVLKEGYTIDSNGVQKKG